MSNWKDKVVVVTVTYKPTSPTISPSQQSSNPLSIRTGRSMSGSTTSVNQLESHLPMHRSINIAS